MDGHVKWTAEDEQLRREIVAEFNEAEHNAESRLSEVFQALEKIDRWLQVKAQASEPLCVNDIVELRIMIDRAWLGL